MGRELVGTGKVFSFSLLQQLKSKVNTISLIIFFLLSAASVPVMILMSGGGEKVAMSDISTVYVQNGTDYTLNPDRAVQINPSFAKTVFQTADFTLENYKEHLKEEEVFVNIEASETGYLIDTYTLEESTLEEEDTDALGQVVYQLFSDAKIESVGASGQQMETLGKAVQTQVMAAEDYLNPNTADWSAQFAVQYAYSILVMMICMISASYVVQAIAEEKSSKLVELLMVSVRPLALLLGKILAMMAYILILIGVLILGFGVSYAISGVFLDVSVLSAGGAMLGISFGSFHLGVVEAVIIVISLLLGYLTFSIVAGLAGCCCASIEDVQGANMTVVMIVMAGYLAACIVSAFTSEPVYVASSLIPVISVFCAPVQYVMGNIGLGVLLLSWLLQLVVIAGLSLFSSRVYNSLIIYRGSRVKFRQLLSMVKKNGGLKA
ncbi:MAG: ABC transporter permease [Lachnospiraceae bacterium]|nr:ABC transporter permease [Lachnospiraceae bacterium]